MLIHWQIQKLWKVAFGEDYVLLFTADSTKSNNIQKLFHQKFERELFHIGKITNKSGILEIKNKQSEIEIRKPGGFQHEF